MVQVEAEEEDGGDAEETERIGCAERAHFLLATEAAVQIGAPRYFVSASRNTCSYLQSVVVHVCHVWMEARSGERRAGRHRHRVDASSLAFSLRVPALPDMRYDIDIDIDRSRSPSRLLLLMHVDAYMM